MYVHCIYWYYGLFTPLSFNINLRKPKQGNLKVIWFHIFWSRGFLIDLQFILFLNSKHVRFWQEKYLVTDNGQVPLLRFNLKMQHSVNIIMFSLFYGEQWKKVYIRITNVTFCFAIPIIWLNANSEKLSTIRGKREICHALNDLYAIFWWGVVAFGQAMF